MRSIYFFASLMSLSINAQVFNGLTLFSSYSDDLDEDNHYTKLINNNQNVLHSWNHDRGSASMPYLLTDGTLLYPYRVENPSMCNGGVGGGIALYDWYGNILWSYEFSNNLYQHHHDICPLPNGNILVLVWERHTATQSTDSDFYGGEARGWAEMGRQEVQNPLNQMWSESVFEIEMIGHDGINIIWEWHLWDHLVQDVDSSLLNYGDISTHLELIDINYGDVGGFDGMCGPQGDWIHFNALDYNQELDQIVLSSRNNNEIYIIDHSTTTTEAASHSGGNSGMGGDILYRWGNPQVYNQGNDFNQQLDSQHGVNWIPQSYPGAGNLILFNNFYNGQWQSIVYEIVPPINQFGTYDLNNNYTYGPNSPSWFFIADFFSWIQSGAYRLPNGNTLVTVATSGQIIEVANEPPQVIWNYELDNSQMIARAQKYSLDYLEPGFNVGDIDFDYTFSVNDLFILVDLIYFDSSDISPQADINLDGNLDMLDISCLLEIILEDLR